MKTYQALMLGLTVGFVTVIAMAPKAEAQSTSVCAQVATCNLSKVKATTGNFTTTNSAFIDAGTVLIKDDLRVVAGAEFQGQPAGVSGGQSVAIGVISSTGAVCMGVTGVVSSLGNCQFYSDGAITIVNATTGNSLAFRVANANRITMSTAGKLGYTFTDSSGAPGNVTNNSISGIVAWSAATNLLTVTSSAVTTTTIPFLQVLTTDATCKSAVAVPSNGSFTVTGNAACTGITKVGFLLVNP